MEFKNYLYLAVSSLLLIFYNVFKKVSEGVRLKIATILTEASLTFIFSLLIVPFAMIRLKLEIEGGIFIATILSIFSKIIISASEKKIEEKINKL
jgi:hypothetical protein